MASAAGSPELNSLTCTEISQYEEHLGGAGRSSIETVGIRTTCSVVVDADEGGRTEATILARTGKVGVPSSRKEIEVAHSMSLEA